MEEAIQIARRIGDPATLAYALTAAESALHAPHTAQRRLAEGGEIVSLAAEPATASGSSTATSTRSGPPGSSATPTGARPSSRR